MKNHYLKIIVFLFATYSLSAQTIVDHSGSGDYLTLTDAFLNASPGETIRIKSGIYHEDTIFQSISGTSTSPILIEPFGDGPVKFTGTKEISTPWVLHSGNIYKTTLPATSPSNPGDFPEGIWQLFVNDTMMVSARWPNAQSPWEDNSNWWSTLTSSFARSQPPGKVLNGGAHNLAATNLDFTGGVAVMNLNSMITYQVLIENHGPGSDTFTYDHTGLYKFPTSAYINGNYYIEAHLACLDTAGEWYYDKDTRELYLWAPDNVDPNALSIKGKVKDYSFSFGNCDYITIKGLEFEGSTICTWGANSFVVEDCSFKYPTYSKRMLGDVSNIQVTYLKGNNISFRNNTVEYTDGTGLHIRGNNCTIENNLFHHIDISCVAGYDWSGVGIAGRRCSNLNVKRNVLYMSGGSEGIRPGSRSLTEYNDISQTGFLQGDGAMVQIGPGGQSGSIIRYNWFHNSNKIGVRFDGNPGGNRGTMHHNVCWGVRRGLMVKGNFHKIFHNTGFENGQNQNDIAFAFTKGGNDSSKLVNNLGNKIGRTTNAHGVLPGIHYNNWNGYVEGYLLQDSLLMAPYDLDFRPNGNQSVIIDSAALLPGFNDSYFGTAPDIGAYEKQDTVYWIAGRKRSNTSVPIPSSTPTNVKLDTDLKWLGTYGGELGFQVYFGDSYNSVENANLSSSQYMGFQTNNIYAPCIHTNNQSYYWRVDALKVDGTIVKGAVWEIKVNDTSGTLCAVNSVEEAINRTILIYPNPSSSHLTIDLKSTNFSPKRAVFYNMVGQVIYKVSLHESKSTLNIEHINQGLYFISIEEDNKPILTKKIRIVK